MGHNPLALQLEEKAGYLEAARLRRAELQAALDWHAAFNRSAAEKALRKRQAKRDTTKEQLAEAETALANARQQTAVLKTRTEAGWDPRYWISDERRQARTSLDNHRVKLTELQGRQAELSERLERSRHKLGTTKRALAKFDKFNEVAARAELAAVDAEIPERQAEHDALAERSVRLNAQLEGPVKVLDELLADLKRTMYSRASLSSDVSTYDDDIEIAEKLRQQLDNASEGYERRPIHEKCDAKFGDGSPGRVISDRRQKRSRAKDEIRALDRRIPALERDVRKAEQRVATVIKRGTLEVKTLIVDGNNLCYEGSSFIGITALRPLCLHLREHYDLSVVFDAPIRHLLGGLSEESLRERFPNMTVHIVASRTQADETILAAAANPTVYVVSNDRFAEYRDKAAVREHRVLTHEILNGHVLVHDLGVDVIYDPLA